VRASAGVARAAAPSRSARPPRIRPATGRRHRSATHMRRKRRTPRATRAHDRGLRQPSPGRRGCNRGPSSRNAHPRYPAEPRSRETCGILAHDGEPGTLTLDEVPSQLERHRGATPTLKHHQHSLAVHRVRPEGTLTCRFRPTISRADDCSRQHPRRPRDRIGDTRRVREEHRLDDRNAAR
jgi:hypothetical protein